MHGIHNMLSSISNVYVHAPSSHLLECQIKKIPSQFLNTTLPADKNSFCLFVFYHPCSGTRLHQRKMYHLVVCYTAGDMIKEIANLKYLGHTLLFDGKLRTEIKESVDMAHVS